VPSDRIDVRLGDARQSIRMLPSDAFDVVIGDAFGGIAVPWHLTTSEFLEQVARVLRPGGAYVANLIDYPPLRFVRAEAATAATVFSQVAVIANRQTIDGGGGGNLVLVASVHRSTGQGWRPRLGPGGKGQRRRFSLPLTRWRRSSVRQPRSRTTSRRSTNSWGARGWDIVGPGHPSQRVAAPGSAAPGR
jgi:hypothetical protein